MLDLTVKINYIVLFKLFGFVFGVWDSKRAQAPQAQPMSLGSSKLDTCP
jgi:hypothetical protein